MLALNTYEVNILYVGCLCNLVDMNMLIDDFERYIGHLYHKGQCDMLLHILDLHIFRMIDTQGHFYIEV